jgi:hypothetical protein
MAGASIVLYFQASPPLFAQAFDTNLAFTLANCEKMWLLPAEPVSTDQDVSQGVEVPGA